MSGCLRTELTLEGKLFTACGLVAAFIRTLGGWPGRRGVVAGLVPELMLTPPGILGLGPGPCALGPLLPGLAPPLKLIPGGRLGGALAVGCGGGFEGEGPRL